MSSSHPRDVLLEVSRLEKKRKIKNFLNVWVNVIECCLLHCRKGRLRKFHVHKTESYKWAQRNKRNNRPCFMHNDQVTW